MEFLSTWRFFRKEFFQLNNRYVVKQTVQSIERSVLLSLTVSFSFLSKIKYGSTMTRIYIRGAFQILCWTTGDLLSHKDWEVLVLIDDQFPLFLQAHRLQGGLSCSEGRWKHCYRRWHSDTGVFVCEQMCLFVFMYDYIWLRTGDWWPPYVPILSALGGVELLGSPLPPAPAQ